MHEEPTAQEQGFDPRDQRDERDDVADDKEPTAQEQGWGGSPGKGFDPRDQRDERDDVADDDLDGDTEDEQESSVREACTVQRPDGSRYILEAGEEQDDIRDGEEVIARGSAVQ